MKSQERQLHTLYPKRLMTNKIFYNETNYDKSEINAVVDVLRHSKHSLVGGTNTKNFESKVSKMFGKKYGLFVNSALLQYYWHLQH